MAKQQPIEIFMPPNMLKAKVGGRLAGIDMAAVRRAEAAMSELEPEFGNWIADDVHALTEAGNAFLESATVVNRYALFRSSHDLRGQALTFGFPLVMRAATSLCKMLDGHDNPVPVTLVEAHINAIRVIVKQNVTDPDDKIGSLLVKELDEKVKAYLEKLGISE